MTCRVIDDARGSGLNFALGVSLPGKAMDRTIPLSDGTVDGYSPQRQRLIWIKIIEMENALRSADCKIKKLEKKVKVLVYKLKKKKRRLRGARLALV